MFPLLDSCLVDLKWRIWQSHEGEGTFTGSKDRRRILECTRDHTLCLVDQLVQPIRRGHAQQKEQCLIL